LRREGAKVRNTEVTWMLVEYGHHGSRGDSTARKTRLLLEITVVLDFYGLLLT
jgi:hypothetical protein